jgi:hypothetical protein
MLTLTDAGAALVESVILLQWKLIASFDRLDQILPDTADSTQA